MNSPAHNGQREVLLFIVLNKKERFAGLLQAVNAWMAAQSGSLAVEVALNDLREDAGIGDTVNSSERMPDAILSIKHTGESLPGSLSTLVMQLAGVIDVVHTRVMGAICHEILAGWGPVRLHYGLRRLSHLDRAAFQAYWLGHHADIGRALIPPYSYYQSHADQQATEALATLTGWPQADFDGVATVHFPDEVACDRQLSRVDVAEIALEDEKNFIDHARAQFGLLSCQKLS